MLVDSGATVTALSTDTVEAAGLRLSPSPFPMIIQTANGSVRADTATVPELRIGNIVARDLPVVSSPAFGDMKFGGLAARFALVALCALATTVPAQARFWQCAPYAREISGIQIFGNANTWWSQAAGKYERGNTPKVGSVLAFASFGRMPLGHAQGRGLARAVRAEHAVDRAGRHCEVDAVDHPSPPEILDEAVGGDGQRLRHATSLDWFVRGSGAK